MRFSYGSRRKVRNCAIGCGAVAAVAAAASLIVRKCKNKRV